MNLVRLANLTCHKLCIGLKREPGLLLSTTTEAINLRANDLVLAELQIKIEEQTEALEKKL